MAGYENGAIFVLRPSPPPRHGQATPAPSPALVLLPMSKHALLALALAPPRARAQGAQEYRGVAGGTGALVYLFSLLLGSGVACGVASGAVLARVALPGAGVSAAAALGLQAPGHWLVGCWDGSVRLVGEGEGEGLAPSCAALQHAGSGVYAVAAGSWQGGGSGGPGPLAYAAGTKDGRIALATLAV